MAKNYALKDMFNQNTVGALAKAIASELPDFPEDQFLEQVFDDNWEKLALKKRVRHITLILGALLPPDYSEALDLLTRSLPHLGDQGFEKMVFPDFVEVFGLEDWDISLQALEEITQHVSGEFAIRAFIDRYPDQTLSIMREWAVHPHPGVRRLASEGCRPRLPWGIRLSNLINDPSPILPILEILKDDEREEIRRSVANNLNDISKDHPDLVLDLLMKWQESGNDQRTRLIQHALRTLIKGGHPRALELLGYSSNPEIKVCHVSLNPEKVQMGGETVLTFEILSTGKADQDIIIDYIVHFQRAKGKRYPKVFKLSKKTIKPGETIQIRKKHSFQPISTRKYYPGKQTFQPQINGKVFEAVDLDLY